MAAVSVKFFFLAPLYSLAFDDPKTLFRLSMFVLVAMMISLPSTALRTAQQRTQESLEKLQETQELFESFMKYNPATAFIKDEAGRYLYVNPKVEQSQKRKLEDWLGTTDFDYFPAEMAQQLRDNDLAVLAQDRSVEFLERVLFPDGEHLFTSFKFPLRYVNGRRLVAGISVDITESRRIQDALQASEERYRLLTEALPQMVWISHTDGQVQYCNSYWYNYTGLTQEQTLGDWWGEVLHPDDVARTIERWQIAGERKESYEIEYRFRRADGEYRWFLASVAPLLDSQGKIINWVATAVDIHDRKLADAERAQLLAREQAARREAEAAQEQAEIERSRLREFFMKAPALIAVTSGPNHIYEFANSAHLQVTGRKEEEIIGKPLREVFPELEGQGFLEILDAAYQTGVAFAGNEMPTLINVKGTIYEAFFNYVHQPLKNAQGEVEGILLHAVEVTEQVRSRQRTEELMRQLEAERALLAAVLQQLPSGVIIAEAPSGKLILGNQQVEQIWRHPFRASAEVEEYREYKGFHPDGRLYAPEEWPVARSITTGEEVTGEQIKFLRGDKTFGMMEVSSAPIRDRNGNILAGVVTFQDITERKEAEKEREQLLAREQAAREEAEAANRIKDEFLAVLSHELRSPLNPILGWTKLLRTRQFDAEKTDRALETIERNAKLQAQLVEDLLDVSRILQGKLSLNVSPVRLASVIEAAIETVRLAATAKSIEILTIFAPSVISVSGDANRLQQVVWNLVSNAVKFTPAGGRVEVRLERVDNRAEIKVIDNGKGINPDFLPYVFDYFRQADSSTTRKFGGLGLGLAIVRQVVEMHGGTVRAESPGEGLGATFTVRLPLLKGKEKSEEEKDSISNLTPDSSPLAGLKVLVVDDEADMRDLVTFILQHNGAQVKAVASANEALEAINKSLPDILISDVGMPEVDGYMLMRQIRCLKPEKGGKIPAIALTAYAGDINERQAFSAGFQKHLAKPIEPDLLVQTILSLTK